MSSFSYHKLVKFNVGGTIFQTSRFTLTKYDCMFRAMLQSGVPTDLDHSGCIFIDRDPTHFRLILNFMRDGAIELPKDQKDVKEILKEAEFYCLEELVHFCHNYTLYMPTQLNPDFRVVKTKGELFEVLVKAEKDVLIIYVSVVLHDLQANLHLFREFSQKNKGKVDIVFMVKEHNGQKWSINYYSLGKEINSEKFRKIGFHERELECFLKSVANFLSADLD